MAKRAPKDETKEKASIYLDADFILERNNQVIPVSPAIDPILCGGIPEGVLMLISGPQKLGKTTLALTAIANAQKIGKVGVIADVEHRIREKNLSGIHGLDLSPDKLKFIRSSPGSILTAEQILERTEQSLHDFPGSVVFLDSLSMLSSSIEQTSGYNDKQMGGTGALQAKFCRRVAPIISVNGNIVICSAHVAANIGTPGTTENVGRKALYQLDIRVTCKKPFKTNDGVDPEWFINDKKIGHRIIWECSTNAIGAGGNKSVGYLKYGYGLDEVAETMDQAIEMGLVEEAGSWLKIDGKSIQGWEKAYLYLQENPDLVKGLTKSLKEMTNESA